MALFDLPLAELRRYQPERHEPPDFDAFWEQTLAGVRRHDLQASFAPVDAHLGTVETLEVTFSGWNGEPVRAWMLLPAGRSEPLPCVVQYNGYGSGRGSVYDHLLFSAAGYAHLVMDNRGQATADTPDSPLMTNGPRHSGFITAGVLDRDAYYYRRLMSDAARAVEAARAHPGVDPARVVVAGRSQGGGLALAVAGLVPGLAGVLSEVPFLCHYRRATEITDSDPYREIAQLCRVRPDLAERVFGTLAYFDGVNFAARAEAPALFSVGLMDTVCPPSTVFAAYNHYAGPKDIRTWAYSQHEGGGPHHSAEQLAFLAGLLG